MNQPCGHCANPKNDGGGLTFGLQYFHPVHQPTRCALNCIFCADQSRPPSTPVGVIRNLNCGSGGIQNSPSEPGPPPAALRAMSVSVEGAPTETCDGGWYPHKVSSCFPRSGFSDAATQTIVNYLVPTLPEPNARRYLSLHSMGGTIKGDPVWNEQSCFAFRDKLHAPISGVVGEQG
jgi:hypothetical protein